MTEPKKMGRKPYERDEKLAQQIKTLAGMGIPDYEIVKFVRVSAPTMRKYYMTELETGHIEANAKVAQSLFKQATHAEKPNVSAAIFWLKCRANWREDHGEEPGKKEMRETLSRVADVGTDWEGLIG
jgi:hypothetical protein